MRTVRATLEPNGHHVLPPALVLTKPVPALVTFLEPLAGSAERADGSRVYTCKGRVVARRDSMHFLTVPPQTSCPSEASNSSPR